MKTALKKIWTVVKGLVKVFLIFRIVFGFVYHVLEAIIGCLRHVRKNKQEFNGKTAMEYMNNSGETESVWTGVFRLGNVAWNEYVGYKNDRKEEIRKTEKKIVAMYDSGYTIEEIVDALEESETYVRMVLLLNEQERA